MHLTSYGAEVLRDGNPLVRRIAIIAIIAAADFLELRLGIPADRIGQVGPGDMV